MFVDIVARPVLYFRARLALDPEWLSAALPVGVQTVLLTASAMVVNSRGQAAITDALIRAEVSGAAPPPVGLGVALALISVVVGVAFSFWVSVGALVTLDVWFAGSNQARRLVELSGIAYWSQVPWGVAGGVCVWL